MSPSRVTTARNRGRLRLRNRETRAARRTLRETSRRPNDGGSILSQAFEAVVIAVCALLAAVLIFQTGRSVLWHIGFPYELKGWAEGHFLYNAVQLSRGENIYVDPGLHPVTVMPYGFLYPLVMAPLVRLLGPELWIGRAISVVASLFSLGWVFRTARGRAGSALAGACGVALALSGYFLTGESWDWGHSDSLYVALGLGALMCVEHLDRRHQGARIAGAALLSCASCCAKQTGASFILGIAVFLLLRQRRAGLLFLAAAAGLMGAVWVTGHVLTGGQFEQYMTLILGDPYLSAKIPLLGGYLLTNVPVLLIASGWQIVRDVFRSRGADPVFWAFVCVGLSSAGAFVKVGGVANSLMPLFFLLAVPAGVRFAEMFAALRHRRVNRLLALSALATQLAILEFVAVPQALTRTLWTKLEPYCFEAGRQIDAEFADGSDPILMGDRVAFAVRAGRRLYDSIAMATWDRDPASQITGGSVHYPSIQERVRAQIQDRLKDQFDRRYFQKILVQKEQVQALRPDVVDMLKSRYRVVRVILKDVQIPGLTPMMVLKPVPIPAPPETTRPVPGVHGAAAPG
jgi:hypothetical protein